MWPDEHRVPVNPPDPRLAGARTCRVELLEGTHDAAAGEEVFLQFDEAGGDSVQAARIGELRNETGLLPLVLRDFT